MEQQRWCEPLLHDLVGVTGYYKSVRGKDEIVAEVRRQIKVGADWIKVYASRGSFDSVDTTQTLTFEEMKAIVDGNPFAKVTIESCIVGALQVDSAAEAELVDCIVDANAATSPAYEGPAGSAGAPLRLSECTVIGKLHALALEQVSSSMPSNPVSTSNARSSAPSNIGRPWPGSNTNGMPALSQIRARVVGRSLMRRAFLRRPAAPARARAPA